MFRNQSYKSRLPGPVKGLLLLILAILFFFVLGQVIMFLWNEILVKATGVKNINFWEALGLFLLTRILFGGFRFGSRSEAWKKHRAKKAKWREKWINMSEEERAVFRKKWKERCGKK